MILAITPNPAIDRTLVVPRLTIGEVHRVTQSTIAAGGKGLNVTRVVHQLGGDVTAFGLLGGHSGRLLADLAIQDGINGVWTHIEGETRTCVIIVAEGEDATVVNEIGPTITAEDWSTFIASVVANAQPYDIVALSGSLPRGVPATAPTDFITALQNQGVPVWVDMSGDALRVALTAIPTGIKINATEASDITGLGIHSPADAIKVATKFQQGGIKMVVITLGAQGAVFVHDGNGYHAVPPPIRVVSTVGSGDAFFAGLLTGITQGYPLIVALRRAIAAGTANACAVTGGQIDFSLFTTLLSETRVTSLL